MKTRRETMKGGAMLALFALAVLGAQACGDDDSSDDAPVIGAGRAGAQSSTGGRGGEAGDNDSGAPGDNTGGTRPQGGRSGQGGRAGGTNGPEPEGGTGNDGGTGNEPVGGSGNEGGAPTTDCFAKPKHTDEQNLEFLNQCTRSRCAKFDNFTRIKGFTGTLPKL